MGWKMIGTGGKVFFWDPSSGVTKWSEPVRPALGRGEVKREVVEARVEGERGWGGEEMRGSSERVMGDSEGEQGSKGSSGERELRRSCGEREPEFDAQTEELSFTVQARKPQVVLSGAALELFSQRNKNSLLV